MELNFHFTWFDKIRTNRSMKMRSLKHLILVSKFNGRKMVQLNETYVVLIHNRNNKFVFVMILPLAIK